MPVSLLVVQLEQACDATASTFTLPLYCDKPYLLCLEWSCIYIAFYLCICLSIGFSNWDIFWGDFNLNLIDSNNSLREAERKETLAVKGCST